MLGSVRPSYVVNETDGWSVTVAVTFFSLFFCLIVSGSCNEVEGRGWGWRSNIQPRDGRSMGSRGGASFYVCIDERCILKRLV